MSLLGNNVFANPTTPLWGQGGGGGSNVIPPGGSLTFQGTPNQALTLTDGNITAEDASGNYASFSTGEVRAYDNVGSYVALGTYATNPLGLRAFYDNGGLQNTFAQFDSGGWDLSNVASINGVPYALLPATQYSYQEFPGGVDVSAAPAWGALNTLTITPPVNGKIFLQSQGSFVSQIVGGGVGMTFAINGTNISELPASITAFQGNTNVPLTNLYSFPVSANVPYTISSVAQRSVVPPEPGTDMVVIASRMFLSFSPQ